MTLLTFLQTILSPELCLALTVLLAGLYYLYIRGKRNARPPRELSRFEYRPPIHTPLVSPNGPDALIAEACSLSTSIASGTTPNASSTEAAPSTVESDAASSHHALSSPAKPRVGSPLKFTKKGSTTDARAQTTTPDAKSVVTLNLKKSQQRRMRSVSSDNDPQGLLAESTDSNISVKSTAKASRGRERSEKLMPVMFEQRAGDSDSTAVSSSPQKHRFPPPREQTASLPNLPSSIVPSTPPRLAKVRQRSLSQSPKVKRLVTLLNTDDESELQSEAELYNKHKQSQWLKNERYKKIVERKLKESTNPEGAEFSAQQDCAHYNEYTRAERGKMKAYEEHLEICRVPNEVEIEAERCALKWRTQQLQVLFAQKCYDQRKRASLAEENNEGPRLDAESFVHDKIEEKRKQALYLDICKDAASRALASKSMEEQALEAARAYVEEWHARLHVAQLWEEQLQQLKDRIASEKEYESECELDARQFNTYNRKETAKLCAYRRLKFENQKKYSESNETLESASLDAIAFSHESLLEKSRTLQYARLVDSLRLQIPGKLRLEEEAVQDAVQYAVERDRNISAKFGYAQLLAQLRASS